MTVTRKPGFSQVCVWEGTVLKPGHTKEFEQHMLREFDTRVQFLEEIPTLPDVDEDGDPVPGTEGRSDLFFAVHNDDLARFAILRLPVGIRWIEDALWSVNYASRIYPDRVFDYRTWDPEIDDAEDADLTFNVFQSDHLRPASVRKPPVTSMPLVRIDLTPGCEVGVETT